MQYRASTRRQIIQLGGGVAGTYPVYLGRLVGNDGDNNDENDHQEHKQAKLLPTRFVLAGGGGGKQKNQCQTKVAHQQIMTNQLKNLCDRQFG